MSLVLTDISTDIEKYLKDNRKECFLFEENPYPAYGLDLVHLKDFSSLFGVDLVDMETKDDSLSFFFLAISSIYKVTVIGRTEETFDVTVKHIQIENYDSELDMFYGYTQDVIDEVPLVSKPYIEVISKVLEETGSSTFAEKISHSAGWVYDKDSNFYFRPRYMGY